MKWASAKAYVDNAMTSLVCFGQRYDIFSMIQNS